MSVERSDPRGREGKKSEVSDSHRNDVSPLTQGLRYRAACEKGSKKDASHYRPISLTSVVCKIFESILRDSIIAHFQVSKRFTNWQFGFIKGGPTFLQLLQILMTGHFSSRKVVKLT